MLDNAKTDASGVQYSLPQHRTIGPNNFTLENQDMILSNIFDAHAHSNNTHLSLRNSQISSYIYIYIYSPTTID